MKQSESIAALAAALVKAQGDLAPVAKDSVNPEFRSKYASLDSLIEYVRPILAKHGLAVLQGAVSPDRDEAGHVAAFSVETMLVHASGEWLSNAVVVPVVGRMLKGGGVGDVTAQSAGSALTYGRRTGVSALLALSTEDDDDGHVATANAHNQGRSFGNGAGGAPVGNPAGSEQTAASPRSTPAAAPAPDRCARCDALEGAGETWLSVEQEGFRDLTNSLEILADYTSDKQAKDVHVAKLRRLFLGMRERLAASAPAVGGG